ncbi:putative dienelactone hydrolase [Caulobacter ginsengisoli]|uniref:Dienelactone hydrolase n=1 Tax=Caulobacter ginsengisoli TaxID=400775 RepID=A0ABU0IUB3_9CAUL|nr:hypothetical protein [Caulobacter ginsengisoli]MDQ0464728.1 putative dienelactone hydrolase [Caulobacter ginsengisoli]
MRPFEILLLAAMAAGVAALARPWLARIAVLAMVFTLFGHQLVDLPRWQMFPAYLLCLILAAAVLVRQGRPAPIPLVIAAGLGLVLCAAPPIAFPVFSLPAPDGPYAVGTVSYHWVDADRAEIFTADPADRRELMVQVWYPAAPTTDPRRAPYVPDTRALAPMARLLRLPAFMMSHLGLIRTNAVPDAPAAAGRFPVLVFAHGRAGYAQHNSVQAEMLASHGYVVIAMAQPYAATGVVFPDGRRAAFDRRMMDRRFIDQVIPFLAGDASFVLDELARLDRADPGGRLTGRLDLSRAGMFGLSLGGAVTAQACRDDRRFKACLPMDVFMPAAVVRSGLKQPTMWLSRDAALMRREGWAEVDVLETQSTMRAVFDRLPGEGWIVRAPGFYHQDFSDMPMFLRPPLGRWLGLDGPVEPRRARAIVNAYSLAFFDHTLKGRPEPLLDGPSSAWSDVRLERRR